MQEKPHLSDDNVDKKEVWDRKTKIRRKGKEIIIKHMLCIFIVGKS